MPLPPTRYIDAGPGVPLANPQTAMAEADAMSRMGETISAVGQQGFQVAEKVRKIEEAGKMSAFFSNLDEEAAQFSNELMTRSDTGAWPTEWKEKTTEMRDRLKGLGISPEGRARAELEFGDWSSRRSIQFETQAASKAVAMGRAQAVQSMNYYASRGDLDSYRREADRALQGGILNPVEHEQALRDGETIATETALDEDIRNDPAGVLARLADRDAFMAANPGANLNMIEHAERKAQGQASEFRANELDQIEDAMTTGRFTGADLEAAQYLTDKDRRAVTGALAQKDPPSNEIHARSWVMLESLRKLRNDPAVTAEQYREAWNESRAAVLSGIAPQWQGDIKKEMSYLSPAGRNPDGLSADSETGEDLAALGREQATRALRAGVFGDVAEDTPYAKKEPAFRKFEDIRQAVKSYVLKNPSVGRDEVRKFTDHLISGDTAAAASKKIPLIPGAGTSMRPLPGMESGQGGMIGSGVLPPKNTTPEDQLFEFIQ